MNLLAPRFINKLDRFICMYLDPLVKAVDTLMAPWPPLQCRIEMEGIAVMLLILDLPRQMYSKLISLLAYAAWVFPDQPGGLSQGPILPTCFRVTGCIGMAVEAQLLRDRILNDSVIHTMLKARTLIFLKICHLHGRHTSLNAGKTTSTTNHDLLL